MADIYELKHRISSIKQTRQITNAMYLLSTSRMRKASSNLEKNKQYFRRVRVAMKDILKRVPDMEHPYLREKDINSPDSFIVVAGDKGMAGSYNNDVLRFASQRMKRSQRIHLMTVGNIAQSFFAEKADEYDLNIELEINFPNISNNPTLSNARMLAFYVQDFYDIGLLDEVHLIFTRYDVPGGPMPVEFKLLPLSIDDFQDVSEGDENATEFLYDPSPQEVFTNLAPQFLIGEIYGALVHGFASENMMRMVSMEKATSNADDMINEFTQMYNTARQERITNELTEIISAASAFGDESEQ